MPPPLCEEELGAAEIALAAWIVADDALTICLTDPAQMATGKTCCSLEWLARRRVFLIGCLSENLAMVRRRVENAKASPTP